MYDAMSQVIWMSSVLGADEKTLQVRDAIAGMEEELVSQLVSVSMPKRMHYWKQVESASAKVQFCIAIRKFDPRPTCREAKAYLWLGDALA